MKLNRRNVLIGLGTIAAGGGAALGTGAFSSVEADRNVSISTAGDDAALLGLEITNDTLSGDADDTIEFDIESQLNLDATTTFEDALTISNNADEDDEIGDIDVTIEADGQETVLTSDAGSEDPGMYFEGEENGEGDSTVTLSESEDYHVVFNLEGVTDTGDADADLPEEIEITVEQTPE